MFFKSSSTTIINSSFSSSGNFECTVNSDCKNFHIGSGNYQTKSLPSFDFNRLNVNGVFEVLFEISEKPFVDVSADDNLIDFIQLDYTEGLLDIGLVPNVGFKTKSPLQVKIGHPYLDSVELKGSGDIRVSNLNQNSISATVRGSGDIELSGIVKEAMLEVSGSGDIEADELKSDHLTARLKGSGDIEATALESAQAYLSGSGDIKIFGNPPIKHQDKKGSGKIKFK